MGYGGGANGALWGHINGSPGANWGKVHAILKNREASSSRSMSQGSMPSSGGISMYQSRQVYKEGEDEKCLHCKRPLSIHTPAKKWCPKY